MEMQCVVYALRRKGEKLPSDQVKSRPFPGWLYLGPDTRKHFPMTCARLFRAHGDEYDVLEPLTYASVKSILRGGFLIIGSEEVRSSVTHRQTWFAVPGLLDDSLEGRILPP